MLKRLASYALTLALVGGLVCTPASADPVPCGGTAAPVNTSASGSLKVVSNVATLRIYVCAFDLFGGGTTSVTVNYGSGTNCATGTTALTGAYPLTAQTGLSKSGTYLFIIPAGNDLCVNNGSAVSLQGSFSVGFAP